MVENEKTYLCQLNHSPFTVGYDVLTNVPKHLDPGSAGHIVRDRHYYKY
jgi:hypothetical protein